VEDSQSTEIQGLTKLLAAMEAHGASDLFLSEGKKPAVRLHGQVRGLSQPATTREQLEGLLALTLGAEGERRFVETGDVDAGLSLPDGRRFRLNFSRQQARLNVVARAVPSGALEFDGLGLPVGVRKLADAQRGLVLVTGATGSGKSTTLAAMVHHINRTRRAHIVTIEDPIEFVHRDINCRISQREIGSDTQGFTQALRHVVRQSPDVILIGEMRDTETMTVAMAAALTGHLVLATLHTIDATQTLQRILAHYPDNLRAQIATDLSLCLRGIVSQRLVATEDGKGRVAAIELLTCTPPVAKLLREQRTDELFDLMRGTRTSDILTFNRSLLKLLEDGRISYAVGAAHSTNPDEFALQAKGMSTGVATFGAANQMQQTAYGLDMKALLGMALERGASDLHLTAGRAPIVRLNGRLVPLGDLPLSDTDMRILLNSILSGRQRSIYEIEREIDFALALDDGQRFRVNAYYQRGRMAAALRTIPSTIPDAATLRLPETVLRLGHQPHGLLLVVGPTGSGKSTTLACLVDRINNSRACRILTIEDPIEYAHNSKKATIDQREVYADTKSFGAALKYILRQDPDVILVGEMRDLETISSVLTAAETGHLVLATLHSNDAVQAIDRIVDVFPGHQQGQARSQLASSLIGVVSQRLLRKKGGGGRVPVFETMAATPAIRNLIRENKMHQAKSLMEASRKDGMVTMDHALCDLLAADEISYEEALRYVSNARALPLPD
jgi:twitching motility protein PilT